MGDDEKAATAPRESRKTKGGEKSGESGDAHVKAAEEAAVGGDADERTNQPDEESAETPPAIHKAEAKKVKANAPPEMEKPMVAATSPAVILSKGIVERMRFRRIAAKRR